MIYVRPLRWEIEEVLSEDVLAVTVAEVKESARMDSSETLLDATIEGYIKAVQNRIERWAGITLFKTTFRGYYDSFPVVMRIDKRPNMAVEKIEYIAPDGTLTELSPLIYQVQRFEKKSNIFNADGKCYPTEINWTVDSVQVVVTAGWEDADAIPEDIKSAIKMCVVKMLQGDCGDNDILTKGAIQLLKHYKDEMAWLE